MANSMAERAAPTAKAPMDGRVREKVLIASTNPSPGSARTFSFGTTTFLKLSAAVLDARCPSFSICWVEPHAVHIGAHGRLGCGEAYQFRLFGEDREVFLFEIFLV